MSAYGFVHTPINHSDINFPSEKVGERLPRYTHYGGGLSFCLTAAYSYYYGFLAGCQHNATKQAMLGDTDCRLLPVIGWLPT